MRDIDSVGVFPNITLIEKLNSGFQKVLFRKCLRPQLAIIEQFTSNLNIYGREVIAWLTRT